MRNFIKKIRGLFMPAPVSRFVGHRKTGDVAFNLRMGAGSPGDITRHFPVTAEACQLAAVTPPTLTGQAVVADGLADNAVRLVQAGDTALTAIYGITVRSFPGQASTGTNYGAVALGVNTLPTNQPVDVLRSGYIIAYINPTGGVQPIKGGIVYVWIAASSGAHQQGGFESAATGGSTIALDAKTTFQGGTDASNFGEIAFNI